MNLYPNMTPTEEHANEGKYEKVPKDRSWFKGYFFLLFGITMLILLFLAST